MTPVDDLKIGMFVAIVAHKADPPTNMFGMTMQVRFDGRPLKIVSISLPFVLCADGQGVKHCLDMRMIDVKQVSRHFAANYDTGEARTADAFQTIWGRQKKRRRKKDKPDPRMCPRCGERRVERLQEPGTGVWSLVCRECGQLAGPAT